MIANLRNNAYKHTGWKTSWARQEAWFSLSVLTRPPFSCPGFSFSGLLGRRFFLPKIIDITNNTRTLPWSGFVGSTYITCCFIWTIITGSSLHFSRCKYSKQNVKVLESHISSSPNMGSRIGKYHFSVWSLCEWLVSARAEKRKQPHTKQDP